MNKKIKDLVEPAAIYDCLIISTNPVTEIKDVSLRVICHTLLKFGIANLSICGSITFKKWIGFFSPKTFRIDLCQLIVFSKNFS